MGCASSSSKARGGSTLRKTKSNKSIDSVDISDDDKTRVSEDFKNRQEREQALFREIQAEKEALRQLASRMIEQRCSCESLLELLDETELDELIVQKDTIKRQKQALVKLAKTRPIQIKNWHLYNNKASALNDASIESIADFMNFALLVTSGNLKQPEKKAKRAQSQYQGSEETTTKSAVRHNSLFSRFSRSFSRNDEEPKNLIDGSNHSKSSQHGFSSLDAEVSVHGIAPDSVKLRSKEEQEQLRQDLLTSTIQSIASQNSFYICDMNINDYDFPPGLITLASVSAVIELYKVGGRLSPRAVRKLLRLGYKSLKSRPNTTQINLTGHDRLTVVGDIHGQLSDLLHIVDSSGLPSSSNRYLFNGDFVDRGPYGVEVMCVLMVMHAAMPDYVSLNRGNHEDYAICTAYGFQLECYEKYGDVIFGMFVEVFQQIPLFAIINNDVFVLHGGLFHNKQTTIADLNAIKRTEFSLEDMPEGGEGTTEVPRAKRKEFLKQLVRDALWSDPIDQPGMHHSVRGAGIGFGPDVAKNFLRHNNLKFIVRSHECVRSGYNEPYTGENQKLLCTIFSASDYGSSGNSAAFIVFKLDNENEILPKTPRASVNMTLPDVTSDDGIDENSTQSELKHVENSKLAYIVHYYYIDAEYRDGEGINDLHKDDVHPPVGTNGRLYAKQVYNSMYELDETKQYFVTLEETKSLCVGQGTTLFNLIFDKKFALMEALNLVDAKKEGLVTMIQLVHVFADVMKLTLDWFAVLRVLVTDEYKKTHGGKKFVDFYAFLNDFVETSAVPAPPPEEPKVVEPEDPNMDALARYLKTMENMKAANEKEKKTQHTKKSAAVEDTIVVKVQRNNSASVIDVSHHLTNVQQFSGGAAGGAITAPRQDSDSFQSVASRLKAPLSIEVPTDPPARHRFASDHGVEDAALTAASTAVVGTTTSTTGASGVSEEVKESDVILDIALEQQSFHLFNVSKDMLSTLYVNYSALEKAFLYFDRANKGYVTKEDISIGYATAAEMGLTKRFPNLNIDDAVTALDINESGRIDINLFFELFRVSDLQLNPPIDITDDTELTTINTSSKSTSSMRLRAMSIHQLQAAGSIHSPYPMAMSPMGGHAGETRARSDSHLSIEIKGVSINVDELTTAVAQHSAQHHEPKSDKVDV